MLVATKKYKFYIIKTKFYRFIIKLKKLSIDLKKVKVIVGNTWVHLIGLLTDGINSCLIGVESRGL